MFLLKSYIYCSITNNVENKLDFVVAANIQHTVEENISYNFHTTNANERYNNLKLKSKF